MMKVLIRLSVLAAMLLASLTHAAEQSVDVTGYGASRNEAVADGLVQGIRQATGVSINSNEVMQSLVASESRHGSDGSHSAQQLKQVQSGRVQMQTAGVVSGYQVHEVRDADTGGFAADMTVNVFKYNKPGFKADSRRTLAVLPFRTDQRSFNLLGDRTTAAKVEADLRNRVLDQFTQSRRVNVLDRAFGTEYEGEAALWSSDNAALQESAKLGNVLGADYLVVGNLRAMNSRKHTRTLELTGETLSSYSGRVQLDYKILLAATRQVKWSDTIEMKFSDRDIRAMLKQYGSSQAGISAWVANELAKKALANIYPIRVVAVKGKTVVLNQGGKTLDKGERLKVFLLGEEMFDPYTQESLGRLEEEIATVKVVRVNAKTTYAKVVEGDAELIERDFIARR